MIELGQHPADEVTLFGHTVHGLVKGTVSDKVCVIDGVEHPLPRDYPLQGPETLQIVRHPAAGPVPLAPEVLAAERAEGRVWQNYALIKGDSFYLYGQALGGYIHIDSLGRRWAVVINSLPDATPGAPYSLTLDCRPFGYLDGAPEDMAPVELHVTCADIQQITIGQRFVRWGMADSTGSRIILMLAPKTPSDALPSGFLQIQISDTAGELAATLSVLRSQEAVRGEWSNTHEAVDDPYTLLDNRHYLPGGPLTGADYPAGPETPYFPAGGGTITLTVDTVYSIPTWINVDNALVGSIEASCERTGRILALAFDEADVLVEYTVDTTIDYTANLPEYTGTAAGTLTAYGDGVPAQTKSSWSGSVAGSISRTVSESLTKRITLRRNGAAVYTIVDEASYSATLTSALPSADWWRPALNGVWLSVDDHITYATSSNGSRFPLWRNESKPASYSHGGNWPESWTAPVAVWESGNLALNQFPWGFDGSESGSDVIGLAFSPYAYRVWADLESATLCERRGTAPSAHWNGVRAYAHASVTLAAMYYSGGTGQRIAYHPVEHTTYIDTDNSSPSYV